MRAPSRPERRLRPDRVSRFRKSESASRSSAPRDAGTGDQPIDLLDLTIVTPYESWGMGSVECSLSPTPPFPLSLYLTGSISLTSIHPLYLRCGQPLEVSTASS